MTRTRAFRPTVPNGLDQMEARVVLSHFGGTGPLVVPLIHAEKVQHGGSPHHAAGHAGGAAHHGRAVHPGPGTRTHTTQATPSSPSKIVVVPPVASPPVATTPQSNPPVVSPPATPITTPSAIPTVSGVMSADEQSIVDLVNQQRQANGLAPLQVDSRLVEAAQIQSHDMAQLGQMEHVLSGAALPTPESRAQYVGYNFSWLGENIAFNYPDANSVMTGWMNSPGHRANILNPSFTQIGVGIAFDSQGEPYYTQDFGTPM